MFATDLNTKNDGIDYLDVRSYKQVEDIVEKIEKWSTTALCESGLLCASKSYVAAEGCKATGV